LNHGARKTSPALNKMISSKETPNHSIRERWTRMSNQFRT